MYRNKEVISMKFTKRIIVMTFLAVTAAVSTGFAYDYVCNNSQYNCNTNIQYNSDNNTNNTNYATSNNNNQNYCGPNSNFRGCCGYRR